MRVTPSALGIDPADVAERGRQAGRDFGDDPAAAIDALVSRVLDQLATAGNPLITVIGGLGIRLHTYLPTRTFELAVHCTRYRQGAWHSAHVADRRARRGDGAGDTDRRRDRTRRGGASRADRARHACLPSFSVV